jgi:hypothetical protein
MPLEITVGPP